MKFLLIVLLVHMCIEGLARIVLILSANYPRKVSKRLGTDVIDLQIFLAYIVAISYQLSKM